MDLTVRKATEKDISKLLDLLVQVDMVHHNGRPDIFKGPATKYNEEELKAIIHNEETPVFVCTDENDIPLGHAFCVHKQVVGDSVLTEIRTLVTLNVWTCNQAAMKFYEAMGLKPQRIVMEMIL